MTFCISMENTLLLQDVCSLKTGINLLMWTDWGMSSVALKHKVQQFFVWVRVVDKLTKNLDTVF